ncbi:MAG: 2-phosphosulfolactate phosphatase, partial [Gemmatimonadota bacterium]
DSVLLCGERKSLPIEGFDLGNSPLEYTREQVEDKSLIMTTTNGTRAFLAVSERRGTSAAEGGAIMIASFLNLSAVVGRTLEGEGSVALVCAGREGRFGLDDAACAGALIRGIEERGVETRLNDAGRAARALTGEAGIGETLHASAAGRNLLALELGADVAFCAQVDRTSVVPVLRERKITIE